MIKVDKCCWYWSLKSGAIITGVNFLGTSIFMASLGVWGFTGGDMKETFLRLNEDFTDEKTGNEKKGPGATFLLSVWAS